MHLFLADHPDSPYGLKISELMPGEQAHIHEILFYGIEKFLIE